MIFLSYAREDLEHARELYNLLTAKGLDVWFDMTSLLPGDSWSQATHAAMGKCEFVILLVSQYSVAKTGFVQTELREALRLAALRPFEARFLIPARLDDTELPRQLAVYHACDLRTREGRDSLLLGFGASIRSDQEVEADVARARSLEAVFRSPREAEPDIVRELARSERVCIFTSRGRDLTGAPFAPFLAKRRIENRSTYSMRVLLPEPDSCWTTSREREIRSFDALWPEGRLGTAIIHTLRELRGAIEAGLAEVRFVAAAHLGRVLLTDKCAYLTPYSRRAHGADTPVLKYTPPALFYDWLERMLDHLWACGRPPTVSELGGREGA